jgi:hypothetical protein
LVADDADEAGAAAFVPRAAGDTSQPVRRVDDTLLIHPSTDRLLRSDYDLSSDVENLFGPQYPLFQTYRNYRPIHPEYPADPNHPTPAIYFDQIYRQRWTRVPLFSGATTEPSLDTERNPAFRYGPIQRLSSMTTTRSGVFAVWITVGFFEVKPVANDSRIMSRYNLNDPALRSLFDRIYPEGYTLGKELGSDTGDIHRHRAFYLVDRTLPVAFKPGEDLNVDKAVLVRRRIE